MSKRKTFGAGTLFQTIFGINRGRVMTTFNALDISVEVNLDTWNNDLKKWEGTADIITAYQMIPFTDGKISAGKVVIMFYIFKNYFIFAAECEDE